MYYIYIGYIYYLLLYISYILTYSYIDIDVQFANIYPIV